MHKYPLDKLIKEYAKTNAAVQSARGMMRRERSGSDYCGHAGFLGPDVHFIPVIIELFTAIETSDIRLAPVFLNALRDTAATSGRQRERCPAMRTSKESV